jgi:hypothetical protein
MPLVWAIIYRTMCHDPSVYQVFLDQLKENKRSEKNNDDAVFHLDGSKIACCRGGNRGEDLAMRGARETLNRGQSRSPLQERIRIVVRR